jgi:hypothetical protein
VGGVGCSVGGIGWSVGSTDEASSAAEAGNVDSAAHAIARVGDDGVIGGGAGDEGETGEEGVDGDGVGVQTRGVKIYFILVCKFVCFT